MPHTNEPEGQLNIPSFLLNPTAPRISDPRPTEGEAQERPRRKPKASSKPRPSTGTQRKPRTKRRAQGRATAQAADKIEVQAVPVAARADDVPEATEPERIAATIAEVANEPTQVADAGLEEQDAHPEANLAASEAETQPDEAEQEASEDAASDAGESEQPEAQADDEVEEDASAANESATDELVASEDADEAEADLGEHTAPEAIPVPEVTVETEDATEQELADDSQPEAEQEAETDEEAEAGKEPDAPTDEEGADEPEPVAEEAEVEDEAADDAEQTDGAKAATEQELVDDPDPRKSREDEVDAMMQSVMQAIRDEQETETEDGGTSDEEAESDEADDHGDEDDEHAPEVIPEHQRIGESKRKAESRRAILFDSIPTLDPLPEPESVRVLKPEPSRPSKRKPQAKHSEHDAPEEKPALTLGFAGTSSPASKPKHADDTATNKDKATAKERPAAKAKPEVKPPTLKEDLKELDGLERRLFAHRYAQLELEAFGATIDPKEAMEDRAEALAVLAEEDHDLLCRPEVTDMLERLSQRTDELDPVVAAQVRVLARDQHRVASVPANLHSRLVRLTSEAYDVWVRARKEDDWRSFAPYLDRIVKLRRRIALAQNPDARPYDTLLDEYEPGANSAFYDEFFQTIKKTVVPLVAAIGRSPRTLSRACVEGRFDAGRQWDIAYDLCTVMGINEDAHFLTETVHPFSEAMTSHYAVTAARVDPDNVMSNVYTMLHELGHNLYEQGVNPDFNRTSLKGGTSMGMHEAQSRFFENCVGRDRSFMDPLLELMRYRFPGQLGRVTPNQLYRAVNRVKPSLIRTEADEVTYPLHILIRYEIEQLLFDGKATAREVPQLWADKYESYLGVRPKNHVTGALQDVHWAMGDFGYFPTYALGNAYAAQLRAKIIEDGIGWQRCLRECDLAPIRAWLGEHIWQYGRSKDARELIEDACGKPFDATYYTDYLTSKYDALYNLRLG